MLKVCFFSLGNLKAMMWILVSAALALDGRGRDSANSAADATADHVKLRVDADARPASSAQLRQEQVPVYVWSNSELGRILSYLSNLNKTQI